MPSIFLYISRFHKPLYVCMRKALLVTICDSGTYESRFSLAACSCFFRRKMMIWHIPEIRKQIPIKRNNHFFARTARTIKIGIIHNIPFFCFSLRFHLL